jgi:tetratricopeptide (TPR) repeat protein
MSKTLIVESFQETGSSAIDVLSYLTKAQAALEEGNLLLVMEILMEAHKSFPDDVQVLAAMVGMQAKLEHWKQMLPNLDLLISLQPDEIEWPIRRLAALHSCKAFKELVRESLLLLKKEPKNTKILALQASAYKELNELPLGLDVVNVLIELNSSAAEPFLIRGLIYREMGEAKLAKADLLKAESFGDNTPLLLNALGTLHADFHEHEIALDYFRKALSLKAGSETIVLIAINASLSAMSLGEFDKGWQFYAYRKLAMDAQKITYPAWQGENLSGKHLVVRREQGLGDELRFSSVIAEVADEAKLITLECDPRLVELYRRSFPHNVTLVGMSSIIGGQDHGNSYMDVHCAAHIGDLSQYRRRSLDDFPEHYGYLKPDPKRVGYWTDYLQKLEGKINVGVSWKSGNVGGKRSTHYADIKEWLPVLSIEGVNFVNLYYGDSKEDLQWVEAQVGVKVHIPKGIDLRNDIDDLSALMASLDLVVGPHTAPIDLAMAVKGASAWVLPFRHFETKGAFYFGQAYFPWSPATKPVFGDGFKGTMDLVAEELAHIVQTTDPKLTLAELSKLMYVCYGAS